MDLTQKRCVPCEGGTPPLSPAEVAKHVRIAVDSFATAVELELRPSPWTLRRMVLAGAAIDHRPAVHFLASVPDERWITPVSPSLHWLAMEIKTVYSLLRDDEVEAARWLGAMRDTVFERPLPEALSAEAAGIQNDWSLIEALFQRTADPFNQCLSKRMDFRTESFVRNGTESPLGFLDIEALGLCRLALDRGIQPAVGHVTLPLGLLQV